MRAGTCGRAARAVNLSVVRKCGEMYAEVTAARLANLVMCAGCYYKDLASASPPQLQVLATIAYSALCL